MAIAFGLLVKEARLAAGLTQDQLAHLTANVCTSSYISYIERSAAKNRLVRVGLDKVDQLAKILDIPLKTARDSINYAAADMEDEGGGQHSPTADLSVLLAKYERLDHFFRPAAIVLMGGTLDNLYQLQNGNTIKEYLHLEMPSTEAGRAGMKKVPVIYPATTQAEMVPIKK